MVPVCKGTLVCRLTLAVVIQMDFVADYEFIELLKHNKHDLKYFITVSQTEFD